MSILPESEFAYLIDKGFTFEQISEGGQYAIVLKQYPLPPKKYDHEFANILIMLPPGFPDTPPDMFYLFPWVRLRESNCYPSRADVSHQFAGISWQRWSRHSPEWRAGRDGLASFIKRIQHAIETATA
jgi:hypothetical protein